MIYEITNPSDALTCKSDNFIIAAVAIAILGVGQYGIKNENESSPVLFGWEDWLEKNGIKNLENYIDQNREAIATVLESVMLGSVHERQDLDTMLEIIPKDKKQKWITERNDRRRSSLNDIETNAHEYASKLRSNKK